MKLVKYLLSLLQKRETIQSIGITEFHLEVGDLLVYFEQHCKDNKEFLNPIHQIPRYFISQYDFLNPIVKKDLFSCFNCLPIFDPVYSFSRYTIYGQVPITIFVLPYLEIFSNINLFRMFIPKLFCNRSKLLNYSFQYLAIKNISQINMPNSNSQFVNKFFFFLTVFDNSQLFLLNEFFLDDNMS